MKEERSFFLRHLCITYTYYPRGEAGEKDQISYEEEDWEGRRGVWGGATGSKSSRRKGGVELKMGTIPDSIGR